MAGFTQSFNVSVAAAIALAQVTGARRRHLEQAGDLPRRSAFNSATVSRCSPPGWPAA